MIKQTNKQTHKQTD